MSERHDISMIGWVARLILVGAIACAPIAAVVSSNVSTVCTNVSAGAACPHDHGASKHDSASDCCGEQMASSSHCVVVEAEQSDSDSECNECGCCVTMANVVSWTGLVMLDGRTFSPPVDVVASMPAAVPSSLNGDVQLRPPIS